MPRFCYEERLTLPPLVWKTLPARPASAGAGGPTTLLQAARDAYIDDGRIDAGEFEQIVAALLADGLENDLAPVDPRADLIEAWYRPIR